MNIIRLPKDSVISDGEGARCKLPGRCGATVDLVSADEADLRARLDLYWAGVPGAVRVEIEDSPLVGYVGGV